MKTMDYWPMAREYSVWNAAVAALQFWTADLKTHILSSTINQVFNAFFYSTSTHILCQQSNKILFSCFMTILNAAFENKLVLEDEGYESIQKISTYPLHPEEHPGFTMFPVLRTPLLTQFHLHHVVPEICNSDLYAED